MPNSAVEALGDVPKGVWFAAMILGFVFFWPVGLAILFYLIGSGKMHQWKQERWAQRGFGCGPGGFRFHGFHSTGNASFDAYRDETLKKLDDEQKAFAQFVDKLRRAKDQAEFDQFMAERGAAKPAGSAPSA